MFGKYFIHELKNTFKLPLIGILICMFSGLISGLCVNIESKILTSAAVLVWALSIITIIVLMFVTIAKVYSSRLFNSKGYLTLTLPVSTHSILISKTVLILLYSVLYYFGIALTIYAFLRGAFLASVGASLKDLVEVLKQFTYSLLGINANAPFVVNLLTFLDRFMTFAAWLILVLFILTIRNIGWKKGFCTVLSIILAVAIIFLYANITKFDFLPSLFYDYENNRYLFMTAQEVKEMYNANYNLIFYQVNYVAHFIKYGCNLLLLFGGYFLSKYFIQNKLDIR